MATLLVAAAVNIAVGLLINKFFGPKGQDVRQEGPRLGDLHVTSSAYGEMINIHYGTGRMGGQVIWSPGIQEIANVNTQSAGGKGGGGGGSVTTTTFKYTASLAVLLCEGTISEVIRIWADTKLIFDATDGTTEGLTKYNFRVYQGTETQLQDSLIVADKGAAATPAFRGTAYVVFEDMPLADFGNRIPNFSFEVSIASTVGTTRIDLDDTGDILNDINGTSGQDQNQLRISPDADIMHHAEAGSGTGMAKIRSSDLAAISGFNSNESFGRDQNEHISLDGAIYNQQGTGSFEDIFKVSYETGANVYTWAGGTYRSSPGNRLCSQSVVISGVGSLTLQFVGLGLTGGGDASDLLRIFEENADKTSNTVVKTITDIDIGRWGQFFSDPNTGQAFLTTETDALMEIYVCDVDVNFGEGGVGTFGEPQMRLLASLTKGGVDLTGTTDARGFCMLPDEDAFIVSNTVSMAKVDASDGTILETRLDLGFRSRNNWSKGAFFAFAGEGTADPTGNNIHVISVSDLSTHSVTRVNNWFQAIGAPANDTISFAGTAYDHRDHSLTFVRQDLSPGDNLIPRMAKVFLDRITGLATTLDVIQGDLNDRAGLATTEYDVTTLTGETVEGFTLNNQGSVRAAMEPLQSGYLYEGFESDAMMKFALRGGASSDTIEEKFVGILSGRADRIIETRIQEVELPAVFTVRYSDKDRDYQQGSQQDRRSLAPDPTVQTQEEQILDLPIVFVADTVRALSQRWLYTVWAERISENTKIPYRFLALDPTDVFTLNSPRTKGTPQTLLVRGSEITLGADMVLELKATVEDKRANDSSLPGDDGDYQRPSVPNFLPSIFHPLDIPLLGPLDATFQQFSRGYWGVSGQGGTWPGATLFRSKDDGVSFDEVGASSLEAAFGNTTSVLADPINVTTWNEQSVNVNITSGEDRFVTATELQVLNRANGLAVIKANGDVEIIQFQNVTVVDSTNFILDRLLRGRLGTEPLATGHTVGEKIILLETSRIFTHSVELADMGKSHGWVATTLGTTIEENFNVPFTYNGIDLRPYSVSELVAVTSTGDVISTWTRRTRFNGQLLDGIGTVPLNEDSESYDIDYINPSGGALFRTKTVTSETDTYTAAEQSTDGVGATVTIRVFQNSATFPGGRGLVTEITGYVV